MRLPEAATRLFAVVLMALAPLPVAAALVSDALTARVRAGDHVVFMSNGGFDGAPRRFLAALRDG